MSYAGKSSAVAIIDSLTSKINAAPANESGYKAALDDLRIVISEVNKTNALSGGILSITVPVGADTKATALNALTLITDKLNAAQINESGIRSAYYSLLDAEKSFDNENQLS